jgi:hypothetical protein
MVELVPELSGNEILKGCLDLYGYDRNLPVEVRLNTFDFNKAAVCATNTKIMRIYIPQNEATKEFLDANPHFRYPGGSNGNYSPCWGRNKQYHKDGGC